MFMVKVKFENSNKIFDFCISDNDSSHVIDHQKSFLESLDHETYEFRKMHHLYNPETQMFIINTSELKSLNLNSTFLMKNCSDEAQSTVLILDRLYNEIGGKEKETDSVLNASLNTKVSLSSNSLPDIKTIVFKLKNYLSVDIFAEEFISYEGIKRIIDIIKVTSGNTRSYAINALKSLLVYLNCVEYIKENSDVILELYNILINNDNINTINHTLGIFILICNFLKEESVDLIYKAAEEYAKKINSKIFHELVLFINDSSIDIKVNAITMIVLLIRLSRDRNLQAKLLLNLQEGDLHKILEKNSECKSQEFQIQLSNYQKLTGDIVRGSNYEVELYKKKLRDLEKHCQDLEKKVEFVFLNQKFYEEIVDDFIYFKKLSDVCSDIGGYYDPYCPTERYDQRINKKVHIDQHGLINLRKLAEDSRIEETAKIKKLQHELDNLKTKYYDLKADFELISLNNSELKANIYAIQDKNKTPEQINQELFIAELKEENNNLMRKIEILVNKINNLNEDLGKANEEIKACGEKNKFKLKEDESKKFFIISQLQPKNTINLNIEGKIIFFILGCERSENNSLMPGGIKNNNIPLIPIPSVPGQHISIPQTQNIITNIAVTPSIPGVRKIPGVPSIPGVPGVVPSIPIVPGVPSIPGVPNIPGVPSVPGVPIVPGVPSIPGVPNIPGVPSVPGVPIVPGVPSIPGVPNIPGVPSVPGVPTVPGVPSIPGIPNIPGVPSLPGVPNVPGVVPSIPGVPNIPGIPKIPVAPNAPGVPNIAGVPAIPIIPGVPKIPGAPNVPTTPSVPGVPKIPGVTTPSVPGAPGIPTIPGLGKPQVPVIVSPVPQQIVYKPIVTKPPIKLDKKVKNLHWNRVLLLPKEAPNRPQLIWDNVKEVKLDLDEIVTLFEAKASAPVATTSSKVVTNTKKRFFNDKRAQAVGIVCAKMPPTNKIEEALTKMEGTLLSKAQIDSLLREYIKEDEIADYEAMNEPGVQWEKQEEFMIGLLKIASSKQKLSIWAFVLDYPETYESTMANTNILKSACDEIYKNKLLQHLFGYVLTIGNILNAGSTKGQADGFSLDILPKLSGVKDNTGKTMIQYICFLLKKEDENFDNIKKNFPSVGDAAKLAFTEVLSGLNKLKKECRDQSANLQKISIEDEFVKKAKESFNKFSKELEDADKKYADSVKFFQEVVTFYGYGQNDSKYKNPEEFFNLINDFLSEIDRSIPKTEVKKTFNRKHEVGKKVIENSNNMDALLKELKSRVNT